MPTIQDTPPPPFSKHLRDLHHATLRRLFSQLRNHGNKLSEAHGRALSDMAVTYTGMIDRYTPKRVAFDLDCGCGKTQSIVAFIGALEDLNLHRSIAIATSKVESLAELKRDLIKAGVSEKKIGLIHSYDHKQEVTDKWLTSRDPADLKVGSKTYASLPSTEDNANRPYLLLTHNRARNTDDKALLELMEYRGDSRDLVFWDESLFVSDSRSISKVNIEQGLGIFGPLVKAQRGDSSKSMREVLDYLTVCDAALEDELTRQTVEQEEPKEVRLPPAPDEDLDRYHQVLELALKRDDRHRDTLQTLLRYSQGSLRVVPTNQSRGATVSYSIVVPEALDNIVILDASYAIRELCKLDGSIQDAHAGFNGRVKDYSSVKVNFFRGSSGRGPMEDEFRKPPSKRLISREVVDVVKNSIPTNEGVLIFTFKHRGRKKEPNIVETLKADMATAGIDTEARLPDGRKRVAFLTWGSETATNDYAHYSNVIFAGVLHRSDDDLAAAMVGQLDDYEAVVTPTDIRSVQRSEITHLLYQGLSRGSCRMCRDGVAGAMNAWLFHHDLSIEDSLKDAMPGLQWGEWDTKYVVKKESLASKIAEAVLGLMADIDESVPSVSVTSIRRQLTKDVPEYHPNTLTSGLSTAASRLTEMGWEKQGRSFVRTSNN